MKKVKKVLDKIKGSDYNNICSLMKIIQAKLSGSGSVVEHRLAKARVASSNLVFRSIFKVLWPSGKAKVCNTSIPSSILGSTSNFETFKPA